MGLDCKSRPTEAEHPLGQVGSGQRHNTNIRWFETLVILNGSGLQNQTNGTIRTSAGSGPTARHRTSAGSGLIFVHPQFI